MKTMMFNPYNGNPRHPSDIASDPEGILMIDPDEPLLAAQQERNALQAKGTHPAPCARHCEASAFKIEIRRLEGVVNSWKRANSPGGWIDDLRNESAQQERKPEDSAEIWHRRYMEATQRHNDRVAVLGGEIEALEADLQSYKSAWPAWNDAPTCAGIWHVKTSRNHIIEIRASEKTNGMAQTRWYGPIPEDDKP